MNLTITDQAIDPAGWSSVTATCGSVSANVKRSSRGGYVYVTETTGGRRNQHAWSSWEAALGGYRSRAMLCIIRAARDILTPSIATP